MSEHKLQPWQRRILKRGLPRVNLMRTRRSERREGFVATYIDAIAKGLKSDE